MDANVKWYYDETVKKLADSLAKRNILFHYCEDRIAARDKVLQLIPQKSSIGAAGSMTLKETGIMDALENGNYIFKNQYKNGLSKEEGLNLRREGLSCDYFVSGCNAVTKDGILINFNAIGNKVAGLAYAKKCILVAGVNKIVHDLDEGLKRVRNYTTPINCKRLNMKTPCVSDAICRSDKCFLPQYQRNCCQIMIIESEWTAGRLTLVLAGESLGY